MFILGNDVASVSKDGTFRSWKSSEEAGGSGSSFQFSEKANYSAIANLEDLNANESIVAVGDVDGSVVLCSYHSSKDDNKVNIIHKTKGNENQGDYIGM